MAGLDPATQQASVSELVAWMTASRAAMTT